MNAKIYVDGVNHPDAVFIYTLGDFSLTSTKELPPCGKINKIKIEHPGGKIETFHVNVGRRTCYHLSGTYSIEGDINMTETTNEESSMLDPAHYALLYTSTLALEGKIKLKRVEVEEYDGEKRLVVDYVDADFDCDDSDGD